MPPHPPLDAPLLAAFTSGDLNGAARVMRDRAEADGVDAMIVEAVVPVVWELERLWASGRFSVLHEHQVSVMLRTLTTPYLPLAARTKGVFAMACPPGETHDIRQHLFAVLLQQRGLPTLRLGASVPWRAIAETLRHHDAAGWALYVSNPRVVAGRHQIVQHLAKTTPTYLAGPATSKTTIPGTLNLPSGWLDAADLVTRDLAGVHHEPRGGGLSVAALAPPPAPADTGSGPSGPLF